MVSLETESAQGAATRRLLEKSKCRQRIRGKARTKAKKKTSKRGGDAEQPFSSGLFESRAAAFEDSSYAVQLGPSILRALYYETDVNWCTPFWLWSELLKLFPAKEFEQIGQIPPL